MLSTTDITVMESVIARSVKQVKVLTLTYFYDDSGWLATFNFGAKNQETALARIKAGEPISFKFYYRD